MTAQRHMRMPSLRSPHARFWVSHWVPTTFVDGTAHVQRFDTGFAEQRDAFGYYDKVIAAGHAAQVVELVCEVLTANVVNVATAQPATTTRPRRRYDCYGRKVRSAWWLRHFASIKRLVGPTHIGRIVGRMLGFGCSLYRARWPRDGAMAYRSTRTH